MHFHQLPFVRQVCIFIPVSTLLLLYGCAFGWNAYGIPYISSPESHILHVTKMDILFIAPLFELGRFSSAIPAGILGDVIGRKGVIHMCSALHLAAWSLKVFFSSKYLLFVARLVSGLAVGTGNAVLFIYAGEMAPANTRGMILSILYSCYYSGILSQFILARFLPYTTVCYVTLAFAVLSFIMSFFIKESPSYLLSHGQDERAQKIFKWIHSSRPVEDLNKEFEATKEYVHNQRKNVTSMFSGFTHSVNRKSVMLVFNINFLTQMTGLPAVIVFVKKVFKGVGVISEADCAIIFGSAQLLAGCFSTMFVDRMGRRKMYQLTGALCALSHVLTTVLYLMQSQSQETSWLLIMSVSMYACVYAAGLGPLTVIVRGELLPQAVKGIGSGLAVVSAGISCFLLMFLFGWVEDNFGKMGLAYNFMFFTMNCIGLLVLVGFKLPETKHRTLAEIQEIFRNS